MYPFPQLNKSSLNFSLGIEEEFFVSSSDVAMKSNASNLSLELFDHQIETKTAVHNSLESLFIEASAHRAALLHNYFQTEIFGSGTHPGTKIQQQKKHISDRNNYLFRHLGEVNAFTCTCGLHVHVGTDDVEKAIQTLNKIRHFIPMLIAISGNSRFYEGFDTGYSSFRNILLNMLPKTGIPPHFRNHREYLHLKNAFHVDSDVNGYCDKEWWDVRYNEKFSTIEFRMFDSHSDFNQVKFLSSMALLVFFICSEDNTSQHDLNIDPYILNENRWRACRFGLDASFIYPKGKITARELLYETFEQGESFLEMIPAMRHQVSRYKERIEQFKLINSPKCSEEPCSIEQIIDSYKMNFHNTSFI